VDRIASGSQNGDLISLTPWHDDGKKKSRLHETMKQEQETKTGIVNPVPPGLLHVAKWRRESIPVSSPRQPYPKVSVQLRCEAHKHVHAQLDSVVHEWGNSSRCNACADQRRGLH
jgi:hypothetical protein